MDYRTELGIAIKNSRIRLGLSQEKLSEILNVTPTHIKHLESGHRMPSIEILFSLMDVLGLSVDNLVFDTSVKQTQLDVTIQHQLKECSDYEKEIISGIIKVISEHGKEKR